MWYIYHRILLKHKKEGNLAMCDNTDEPGGRNMKRNKPDVGRQILYDLVYT